MCLTDLYLTDSTLESSKPFRSATGFRRMSDAQRRRVQQDLLFALALLLMMIGQNL